MAETQAAGPVELGQAFILKPGQAAALHDGRLRVGFIGVTADSRCPKGEQCAWAGDATVSVWVESRSGARVMHDLHTSANRTQSAAMPGQELRLVTLEPYPVSGRTIAPNEYQATLMLTQPGSAGTAER
jgi:hypothetical protein